MSRIHRRCLRRVSFSLVLASLVFVRADPAWALAVTPDPLQVDLRPAFDVVLTIDFLGMTHGAPAGSTTLVGTVAPADVSLIFTLAADPATSLSITTLSLIGFGLESGLGTLPGLGVDVVSASFTWPDVTFAGPGIGPGETSDPFFISYTGDPTGNDISFELFGALVILGSVEVVPEPSTALLLGSAIVAIAGWRRRR